MERVVMRSVEGSRLRVDEMDATISIPCGTAKPGKGNISMIAAPSSVAPWKAGSFIRLVANPFPLSRHQLSQDCDSKHKH